MAGPDSGVAASETRQGVLAALVAYGFWGFLPILFHMIEHVGAVGIVAERVVWSVLVVGIILLVRGRFGDVKAALGDRRIVGRLLLSSVLLAGNWLLYVYAVESGQVLESSFGYFINPLVNIAIGMVLLGERQNFWQSVAIGIAVVAIAIQAIGLGRVPYIALGLALSFGFYGFFRKTAKVNSTTGLFIESAMIAPLALAYIGYGLVSNGPGPHGDPWTFFLLVMTGPATALPLLLFAFAVQRLRMTTIGMFQYIAPTIQFVLAITYFHEDLNLVRLLSFGLIGVSLAVFSADSWRQRTRLVAA